MRKLLSILVIALFLCGMMPFTSHNMGIAEVSGASTNKPATMAFLDMYPAHSNASGVRLGTVDTPFTYESVPGEVDSRSFQWERKGTNYWGRYSPEDEDNTYLMPYTPQAKDLAGTPEKVVSFGLASTYPKYWAEFYLTVRPEGSLSQEEDKWYIVLDNGGQIWFDPDGSFNDPRYQAKADPQSSRYVPGSNASNPMARIDPVRSNNTQGPYVIDPTHPDYRPRIFFWDRDMALKPGTNRTWQLGWINRPEYIRKGGVNDNDTISDGLVTALDWEVNPLTNWAWNPYQGVPIVPDNYVLTALQFPFTSENATYYNDANNNGTYDSNEFIYSKSYDPLITPTPPDNTVVEVGDYRLTSVSVLVGNESFSYGASETFPIKTGAKDIDLPLKSFRNFVGHDVRFVDNKTPDNSYNPGEYIYQVHGDYDIIKSGDYRLTNVFVTGNYTVKSLEFTYQEIFADKDVLVLLEVLEANGCSGTQYDISVETNVWEGCNPSSTTARLRTPNGEFEPMASRIQKNTVLDPSGEEFQVPACTFHDIQIDYRSYIGVELFRDNGIDNNLGKNLSSDKCLQNSTGDEYKQHRLCEEYLGCTNGITGIPDAGRQLTVFPEYILFHDTSMSENGLGCKEALYEKADQMLPPDPRDPDYTTYYTVQEGDIRRTPVTVERNGNFIEYGPDTKVMPGDADIDLVLFDLWEDVTYTDPDTGVLVTERVYRYKYFDKPELNVLDTVEPAEVWVCDEIYQYGEVIYHDANNNFLVDEGDTRLSECEISGLVFDCGSSISGGTEYYYTTHINHMVQMGQNGNSRYFDVFVLPGSLALNVDIDRPLKVEQTSTVRLSLNNMAALKDGQKVWISVREPKPKDKDADELNKLFDVILDEGGYIGITDDMNNIASRIYYGSNLVSLQYLWGAGNDGFHLDNEVYDRTYITEDGMLALYRGYPNSRENYYPYSYRYDYMLAYGYAYGGRPFPYSNAANTSSPCTDRYRGFWRTYDGSTYTYQLCYYPWDLMMLRNTWIIPMGGQWHVPVNSLSYYPDRYTPVTGYGVFATRTNDYLRVVWRVVTYPFTGRNRDYNYNMYARYGYDRTTPTMRANVARWTSEFEVIINRAGNIIFNYSDRNNGQAGINVPNTLYMRNGDASRNGNFFDDFDVYDSDILNPTSDCGYESLPYIPVIGVSSYYTQKAQMAPWSYGGVTPMGSADWLNGKTLIWGPPEPPDEDLYNEKFYTEFGYIDKDNPVFEFQYTPYRGSCNDGFHGMDGFHAGTSLFNQLQIKAYADLGGVSDIVPPDSDYTGSFNTNYKDPFWIRSLFNKKEWQENYRKIPFLIDPPVPPNTVPGDIQNQYGKHFESIRNVYDCYAIKLYDIEPEDLDIQPLKKCIDLVSSRQPAIQYYVYDADNPNDVNDPANEQFMSHTWFAGDGPNPNYLGEYDYGVDLIGSHEKGTYGRPMIMNYNAHGAGIDYFFTALSGYGQKWQRYIVQVNTDGSYEFWRWFEGDLPGQVFGALDQHDFLYTIRATSIPYGGQWDPVGGGVYGYYHVPDPWRMPAQSLRDMDNSIGMGTCNTANDEFPPLGDVTINDRYGFFGDAGQGSLPAGDPCCNMPYYSPSTSYAPSAIVTYGVPVVIMSPEDDFSGGLGLGVANPKNADTALKIRLYSTHNIYDFNSTVPHPPNFIYDRGPGIDYLGYYDMKVLPSDPQINFTEMQVVDHALQQSRVNYTDGEGAISSFPPPTPQIKADYNPVLYDYTNFRSYPGGQDHTGRAVPVDSSIKSKGHGWNAYPALFDIYKKLGTEFFPMTDYGIYFVLRDAQKNHYTFDPSIYPTMQLARIKVKGPFMTPKYYSPADKKLDTAYRYEGVENVPISYDMSGEITVDSTTSGMWETEGQRVNRVINPITSDPIYIPAEEKNKVARYTHSLYYGEADAQTGGFYEGDYPKDSNTPSGQRQYWFSSSARYYTSWMFYSPSVGYGPTSYQTVPSDYSNTGCFMFAFDELVPIRQGNISIEVETANGVKKIYQDCCQEKITDGIDVQALTINVETPENFMVDSDNTLDVTLEEFDKKKDPDATVPCNDALLVAWQDRGIINHDTGRIEGAGDGWVTNPPRSSDFIELGTQYLPADDINRNGKVSYQDYETEILGSYDLATNTWTSGIIDARTFQRGNGKYHMEFSQSNGSQIDLVGMDFGGVNLRTKDAYSPPDGVVGDDEVLPIILSAYKFGDDNNDRGFTPLYNLESEFPQYSHEVYLSGRTQIDVLSQNVWTVAAMPEPLTAGIQPELQDASEPLTFQVTDESGNPVDLLRQAESKLEAEHTDDNLDIDPIAVRLAVWNQLIKDPHPNPLPQYYWTRTDLHNDDGSLIGNSNAYSSDAGRFEPIEFDMSNSKDGRYAFKGFVANDAGDFDVYVYSIDRRKMGKVNVKVELPNVSYKVTNYDDTSETEFDVPGNPDFVLTAGDNKIYKVKVIVKDAQGRPVEGVGENVSVCGGSASEVARFTPFATTPQNFYRAIQPWYWHYYGTGKPTYRSYYIYNGSYNRLVYGATDYGNHWDLHFGVDSNNNGKLDPENREIERTRDMRYIIFYSTSYGRIYYNASSGRVYYATENVQYDNGTFGIDPFSDANLTLSETEGWGNGCIYNRPYYTPGNYGMMFANFDKRGDDNRISYNDFQPLNISSTDSLNLNKHGETEFYVFGDDICEIGGLVGKNMWTISAFGDVVGSSAGFEPSSPSHFESRYGKQVTYVSYSYQRRAYWCPKDYSYQLDWDAMPSSTLKLRAPQVEVYKSDDMTPIGKSMLDPDAYDLVYGKPNHLQFKFYPADKRDMPLDDNIMMILAGNKAEYRVTSRVNPTGEEAGSAAESLMMITPTGTGLESISLDLDVKNTRIELERCEAPYGSIKFLPKNYFLLNLAKFDVAKGLNIEVTSLSGAIEVNQSNELKVNISEVGTKKTVEGASVTITGPGVKATAKTDENGIAYISIKPNADKAITVTAEKADYVTGKTAIDIGCSTGRSDPIQFNPMNERTNEKRYEISGTVAEDIKTVAVNKTKVDIQEDRTFTHSVYLVEGMNTIIVEAEDMRNRISRKVICVELKTNGPTVLYDQNLEEHQWIDETSVSLTGKVDVNSTLYINNVEAIVDGINWNVEIPVENGNNALHVKAIDDLGNETVETYNVYVYHQRRVECFIGETEATVDETKVKMLQAPFIQDDRTYLDLKFVAAVFNLEFSWNSETKGILLSNDSLRIEMAVDSNKAVVNGEVTTLDAPPITKNGYVCIPVHFVSEIFDAEVEWNQRIRMIIIEFLV